MASAGREHSYQTVVRWTGNLGRGTAGYRAYGREHTIEVAGKVAIEGSSDPAFRGDPARHNPEELLVAAASYHRNVAVLGVYHTVNFGQPWLDDSHCDHGYISLPYLDGLELQLWRTPAGSVSSYWLLPITQAERDFKIEAGWEALEELFEASELDYLDPARPSCV